MIATLLEQVPLNNAIQFGTERLPRTSSRQQSEQPSRQQVSASRFYGNTRLPSNQVDSNPVQTWQPGEFLPPSQIPLDVPPPLPDFHSLIMDMQQAVTTEIHKVQQSVDSLARRVDKIEQNLDEVQTSTSSCTPSSARSTRTRKKCTPTALSVSSTTTS